jgi:putative two-component system response regulator
VCSSDLLTPEERSIMQAHSRVGAKMLKTDDMSIEKSERAAALFHHEAWDGSGYPRGLRGEAIPLEARITAVADIYDALMENRPYRKGMTSQQALEIMGKEKAHFDPVVWRSFLQLMGETPAQAQTANTAP